MKYDIEQLLEAGEVIQIYPEGYSMYPMFVPGRDAAVIKKADVKKIRRAEKAEKLIETANRNGGKDNITVVLIEPFSDEVKEC